MTTRPATTPTRHAMRRISGRLARRLALFLAAISALGAVASDTNAPSLLPPKPKWLTEASLSVRESFDNNIFMSGVSASHLPAAYTLPDGGVAALKDQESWITTLAPKVGFDFAPLLGTSGMLKALTLGYAPEFVTFHDAQTESYDVHRLAAGIKLKRGDFSLTADNLFTYVDGSDTGPSYPGRTNAPTSYYSSFVNSTVRERREQTQDRANLVLLYDQPAWFVRGAGTLLNYNQLTRQLPAGTITNNGYLSHPDRNDANVGADFGYKLATNFAVTIGYRIGAQRQEKLPAAIDKYGQTASSDYQRLLLGFEGKPAKWLTARVQAGPDFRSYTAAAPVRHEDPVTFYGEGLLEARASSSDTFTLKYKQWRWMSSTGKVPDDETQFDLSYVRKLSDQLSLSLGARAARADYHCGLSYSKTKYTPENAITNPRDDWDYTGTAGLRYAFTPNISADLGYMLELGRNADGDVIDGTRNFNRQVASLGVTLKF